MDKEIIDKVMFDNFLMSVPTMVVDTKDRKTISAYGSIDVDDLRSAIDTFKKVPEYGELLKQVKKQKEVIDKVYKKCQSKKGNYDYDVFIKLNESWKTLSRFTEHIKYNLHPIITEAYTCDIKNSINEIIETTKYDVVFKKDILDILNEGKK